MLRPIDGTLVWQGARWSQPQVAGEEPVDRAAAWKDFVQAAVHLNEPRAEMYAQAALIPWLHSEDHSTRLCARSMFRSSRRGSEAARLVDDIGLHGPVDGPGVNLRGTAWLAYGRYHRFEDSRLNAAFDRLTGASFASVRGLLDTAHGFAVRSRLELDADQLAQAERVSRRARETLVSWWEKGMISVRSEGREVPFGQVDLAGWAAHCPLAVEGTTVLLPSSGEVRVYEPESWTAFSEDLEEMRGRALRAEKFGVLGEGSIRTVCAEASDFYRELLERHPEVADERLPAQLMPLFLDSGNASAVDYAAPLLLKCPLNVAVRTAVDELRSRKLPVDGAHWRFFKAAIERGWEPTAEDRDWLVSHLAPPPGASGGFSLAGRQGFEYLIECLAALGPDALKGITLPDITGEAVDARRALVSHCVQSHAADTTLCDRESTWVRELAVLIGGPDTENELMEPLERDLPLCRGELRNLSHNSRNRIAYLLRIPPSPPARARLRVLLRDALSRDQGHYDPYLDRYRKGPESSCLRRIRLGPDRLEAALSYLDMGIMRDRASWRNFYSKLGRALRQLEPSERAAMLSSLPVPSGRLEEMTPRQLSEVRLRVMLGEVGSLRGLVCSSSVNAVARVSDAIERGVVDESLASLRSPGRDEASRHALVREVEKLTSHWEEKPPVLEAWREGAEGWEAELCAAVPGPLAFRAASVILPCSRPSELVPVVREIGVRLEASRLFAADGSAELPEKVLQSLETFLAARSAGNEDSAALRQALAIHGVSLDGPQGGAVGEGARFVTVGGVPLRKR